MLFSSSLHQLKVKNCNACNHIAFLCYLIFFFWYKIPRIETFWSYYLTLLLLDVYKVTIFLNSNILSIFGSENLTIYWFSIYLVYVCICITLFKMWLIILEFIKLYKSEHFLNKKRLSRIKKNKRGMHFAFFLFSFSDWYSDM